MSLSARMIVEEEELLIIISGVTFSVSSGSLLVDLCVDPDWLRLESPDDSYIE